MKDFYGRRKTRQIKEKDSFLLQSLPTDFQKQTGVVNLEIGIGSGDFITQMAYQKPNEFFIGCDLYLNGILSCLKKIKNKNILNIQLYIKNIREILDQTKDYKFFNVFILFPDPWPKTRHHKRRLLQKDFLNQIKEKFTNKLFITTDHDEYGKFITSNTKEIFNTIEISNDRPQDWPYTIYEKKALTQNRKCTYICCKI